MPRFQASIDSGNGIINVDLSSVKSYDIQLKANTQGMLKIAIPDNSL